MFFVYILRSEKDKRRIYVGFSENLKQRLNEHNKGDAKHTSKFKPWKLAFYCVFQDKKMAMDFENYLKSGSGTAFRNKRLVS